MQEPGVCLVGADSVPGDGLGGIRYSFDLFIAPQGFQRFGPGVPDGQQDQPEARDDQQGGWAQGVDH